MANTASAHVDNVLRGLQRPRPEKHCAPAAAWSSDRRDRRVDSAAVSTGVVYIMGAGRSGSTLFGILLGNGPGLFFAGELDSWTRRRGLPNGEDPVLAEFWTPVADRMREWLKDTDTDRFRVFEHPRWLVKRRGKRDRTARSEYRRFNQELFEAVRDQAGADFVIDSSHYPMRRWQLRGIGDLDVRTILLVRDPRTVAASLANPVQTSTKRLWESAAYLWVVHPLSIAVYLTLPKDRRLLVRYEDLVDDPERELRRIGSWLGTDLSEIDPTNLVPGPVFQGNRMRTSPSCATQQTVARFRPCQPRGFTCYGPVAARIRLRAKAPVRGSVIAQDF